MGRGRSSRPPTCRDAIELEFELASARQRKSSFDKIDTLIVALTAFPAGLVAECALIRAREAILRAGRPRTSANRAPES